MQFCTEQENARTTGLWAIRDSDDYGMYGVVCVFFRGGVVVDAGGLKCFLPGSHFLGTADESIIGNTIKVSRPSWPNYRDFLSSTPIFHLLPNHIKYVHLAPLRGVSILNSFLQPKTSEVIPIQLRTNLTQNKA